MAVSSILWADGSGGGGGGGMDVAPPLFLVVLLANYEGGSSCAGYSSPL